MGFFDGSAGGIIGGLASAAGSLVGGLLGNASSAASRDQAAELNKFNYEAQKEFAQNGIRWKVADAKAAGLHPLAALGSSTAQYSPSAVVGSTSDYSWLGDVGQGIGRAIDAKMTARERAKEREVSDQRLQLEFDNRRLQNQFLQTQIDAQKQDMALQLARSAAMSARTQQAAPAMPSVGRSDGHVIAGQAQAYPTAGTVNKPAEVVSSLPGFSHLQSGLNPDVKFRKTATGYKVAMSDQAKSDNEDDLLGTLQWNFANRLAPVFSDVSRSGIRPPASWLPPGHVWTYYPAAGEWRARKRTARGQRLYIGN